MSNYLLIENQGVCPVEGFTILGLSTARGNESKIGQFGSGCKHAVNLLMREGLNPIIYCGTNKLTFSTKVSTMGDKVYNKVFLQVNNAKPQELGFCLEFGELDWNDINMALREFVSNALDQSPEDISMQIVDSPRAKSGTTRIFIPCNETVRQFYINRASRFLYFAGKSNVKIMPKSKPNTPAMIYRKGVFVRHIENEENSLFDYNCGENLKIDEARNLNNWDAQYAAAWMMANSSDMLKHVFKSFMNYTGINKLWEYDFYEYHFTCSEERRNIVKKAWEEVYGNDFIPCLNDIDSQPVQRKGYNTVRVNSNWHVILGKCGIKTSLDYLSKIEMKGGAISDNPALDTTANKVWAWLEKLGLTHNKPMPTVKCFEKTMDCEGLTMGYFDPADQTVYINSQAINSEQTLLEEFSHYITGASDNSRDFQDFAFLVATKACLKMG